MTNIFHIRLVNGDEVIGQISNNETNIIEQPMLVNDMTEVTSGQESIILTRYAEFSDENVIEINPFTVVSKSKVSEKTMSLYLKSVEYDTKYVKPMFDSKLDEVTTKIDSALFNSAQESKSIVVAKAHFHTSKLTH